MAIFRGTGGSGSSSDSTIVDAVTAQAGIATTKADEAEGFRDEAEGFKNTASTAATTATTKATEASTSATTASTKATEATTAKTGAETAQTAAEAARDAALGHSNTANSSAVQTVAGSNTQVVGVYNNIANVNTVAGVNTDVTTVAGISSDVTTVAADASDIGTVSTNITNVNNVGNNIANVNAVHGNASNINTVAADGTDIGTVATNIANVNTVAGISSTVTTVAGLESKMDTVIADASDIGAVAGNIGDVTTVAGINSDVDTVAGIAAKVTTVADNITDVQAADTNATNAASSASNASASATSASNSATTATNKATEASNSATAASNSATTATTKASQAAGSATTAGTSASTATTKASEASASATTATTKAGEAASSASAASGSATTATTKAAEADVSATSAASSATDSATAASTWTNYYSTYLGMADASPTTDVQGNALQTGAFYYDTGAGSNTVGLYVYNGSTWVYSTNYNNVTAPYSLAQDLATNSHDINFGDNAKAKFGSGNDLQIYHDGSTSYIDDLGTGNFVIKSEDFYVYGSATLEPKIRAITNAEVGLYHNGSEKLATTNTGIDVTGTATMDALSVNNGTQSVSSTGNNLQFNRDGGSSYIEQAGTGSIALRTDAKTRSLFASNGDISFYEDTGTTPKFFWDASAESLGIGTTSPNQLLSLNSTASTARGISIDQSGTERVKLLYTNSSGAFDINNTTAGYTSFSNNGSEAMRIDSSGRVGIGTTSPSAKLHIVGANASAPNLATSVTNAKVKIQNHNGSGLSSHQGYTGNSWYTQVANSNGTTAYDLSLNPYGGKVGIGTDSPTAKLDVLVGADQRLLFTTLGTDPFIGAVNGANSAYKPLQLNGSDMKLMTNGSERMRIASSGNVGIGTTSPDRPLDITDSTNDGTGGVVIHSYLPTLELDDISGGGTSFILQHDATNTLFKHGTTERMRIDSSGNVGIGTSSPDEQLVVKCGLYSANQSGGMALQMGDEDESHWKARFKIKSDGSGVPRTVISGVANNSGGSIDAINISNTGKVGIGTTSPASKLHVLGDGDTASKITVERTGGTTGTNILGYNYIGTFANSELRLFTNSTEKMRIDSSGNVGIGTTSPLHKVDIMGDASTAYDATSDSGQSNHDATLQIFNQNTTDESFASLVFRNRNSNVGISRISSISTASATTDMSFVTEHSNTKSEKLRITSQGNVGIGTNNPSFKLDVAGNARASYFALRSNETAPSESAFIYRPSTGVLGFGTSTAERMRIDSSGNLLVGTTSTNATGGGFSFRAGSVHYMNIAHTSSVGHGNYFAAFKHNDTVVGTITKTNTTGVSYNTSSDERLKENITDSADAGSKVDAIQIRQYDWKADGSHQDYGVIAQELVEVAPEAVHQPIDPDDMMGVDYSKLVPMLIKEVQTLRNRVAQLENN